MPGSEGLPPDTANYAIREYLAVLDDAAFGAATPVVPKFLSPSDPASRWTAANGGLAFFACCTNYLIDLKCAVILDVEPTTAVRQAEVTAQHRMLDPVSERFGIWPARLVADASYGSGKTWRRWCTSAASNRISRCSINPLERTAPSHGPTSSTTTSTIDIPAPAARS